MRLHGRRVAVISTLAIAVVTSACTGLAGRSDDRIEPINSREAGRTSMPPTGAVPSDLVDAITDDAAERANVQPEEVAVLSAESVTWSDGSLGCPEPGMMYTQALVPGYRVVVEAGGTQMSFHASERGDFRFCANPNAPMESNPNE
jgi:hypothetical protein